MVPHMLWYALGSAYLLLWQREWKRGNRSLWSTSYLLLGIGLPIETFGTATHNGVIVWTGGTLVLLVVAMFIVGLVRLFTRKKTRV